MAPSNTASILIKDGKIAEMWHHHQGPEDAQVVDARRPVVIPGYRLHSQIAVGRQRGRSSVQSFHRQYRRCLNPMTSTFIRGPRWWRHRRTFCTAPANSIGGRLSSSSSAGAARFQASFEERVPGIKFGREIPNVRIQHSGRNSTLSTTRRA